MKSATLSRKRGFRVLEIIDCQIFTIFVPWKLMWTAPRWRQWWWTVWSVYGGRGELRCIKKKDEEPVRIIHELGNGGGVPYADLSSDSEEEEVVTDSFKDAYILWLTKFGAPKHQRESKWMTFWHSFSDKLYKHSLMKRTIIMIRSWQRKVASIVCQNSLTSRDGKTQMRSCRNEGFSSHHDYLVHRACMVEKLRHVLEYRWTDKSGSFY